jgi:two-component system chemotaxis response regulator CheY
MNAMGYNILIVDDSAVTRAVIRRTLLMAKLPLANVFEAADGAAGLAMLEIHKVDLVLADLHMPNMGGVEMTSRILANQATRNIPVIIVSAEPSDQKFNELKQQGVRGCIRKPFSPETIRDVVHQALGVSNEQ